MARLKTFRWWAIIVIVLFFAVSFGRDWLLRNSYKNLKKYQFLTSEYEMTAGEMKSSEKDGYVKGTVKADRRQDIVGKFVKVDCYSKDTYMGSKYVPIDKIDRSGIFEYTANFKYSSVDNVKIDIVDEEYKPNMRRELEKLQEYIASGQIFVDGANFATTISRSVLEFFGVHVDFNNAVEDGKNASVQYFEHPYLPFLTVLTMVVLFKL